MFRRLLDLLEDPISLSIAFIVFFVVVCGVVFWWAWPKDRDGNPLPCTHYHTATWMQPITVGNTTTYIPQTIQVCDTWASPSPREKVR